LPAVDQHEKDLVPEYGRHLIWFQGWRHRAHGFAVKQPSVTRIWQWETGNIADGPHGDDGAGNGIFFGATIG
jgi:hypothetical protein